MADPSHKVKAEKRKRPLPMLRNAAVDAGESQLAPESGRRGALLAEGFSFGPAQSCKSGPPPSEGKTRLTVSPHTEERAVPPSPGR